MRAAVLKQNLSVRLKQGFFDCVYQWLLTNCKGLGLCSQLLQDGNPAVLEDANIGFGQPKLTGIGKNKPMGKRNKAVSSDRHNGDLYLAKPGSISLYILYKTITRP